MCSPIVYIIFQSVFLALASRLVSLLTSLLASVVANAAKVRLRHAEVWISEFSNVGAVAERKKPCTCVGGLGSLQFSQRLETGDGKHYERCKLPAMKLTVESLGNT